MILNHIASNHKCLKGTVPKNTSVICVLSLMSSQTFYDYDLLPRNTKGIKCNNILVALLMQLQ